MWFSTQQNPYLIRQAGKDQAHGRLNTGGEGTNSCIQFSALLRHSVISSVLKTNFGPAFSPKHENWTEGKLQLTVWEKVRRREVDYL